MKNYEILFVLANLILVTVGQHYDGCAPGWIRYDQFKCVFPLDIDATYEEADNFCRIKYGAQLLNLTDDTERIFWSFQLFRLSNLTNNVWLLKKSAKVNECMVMQSRYGNDHAKVGSIVVKDCDKLGAIACEITANKPLKPEVKEINPNEDVVENKRIKLANGTDSNFFTGIYYIVTSKYKNAAFSNYIYSNHKCDLFDDSLCKTMYQDREIDNKFSNYYMFSSDDGINMQIRRFNSDKLVVAYQDNSLFNYDCGSGSLGKSKNMCQSLMRDGNYNYQWTLTRFNNSDFYIIRAKSNNYTLGAKMFPVGPNGTIGFGLYDPISDHEVVDDRLLFKIQELNFTLHVELYSVSFDKSLEQMVADSSKQVSIVDTEVINNKAPSTLTHQIENSKEMTESYTTTYGMSQTFMDSFTNSQEVGVSLTDTSSTSKSFTDSTSQAVASSLSDTISNTDSVSKTRSVTDKDETKTTHEKSVNLIFVKVSTKTEETHTHEVTDTTTNRHDTTNSETKDHDEQNEHDKSNTDKTDKSHTDGHDKKNGNQTTKGEEKTKSSEVSQTRTQKKTYTIRKIVQLPPYSAVKISSYANWIDSMVIPFNMTLRFKVETFRRQKELAHSNVWRTADAEFVQYIMKQRGFQGDFQKGSFDSEFGVISGSMSASIGLESVFSAKTMKLYNNDDE